MHAENLFITADHHGNDGGKLTSISQRNNMAIHVVNKDTNDLKVNKPEEAAGLVKDKTNVNIVEHLLPISEVSKKFNVTLNEQRVSESSGLSTEEASKRLSENGPNILTPPKKRHWSLRFLDLMLGLFNVLLIFCSIVSIVLYCINTAAGPLQLILGIIYFLIALMNAGIEFFQQQKSAALMDSFMSLIPSNCLVIRDGKQSLIPAQDMVLGDIAYIRMGDKIPADILIIGSTDFKVDNSPLTGEAEPQERSKKNTQENPLEATNLAFNGTLAVSGECFGIVIRCGDNTVIGQIASLTSGEEKRESPLQTEINGFVQIITVMAAITALALFIAALRGNNPTIANAFTIAIGVFVGFVPEGLPATVSILLSIAAKRMAKRQVLVKDLQGVETLGAVTLLATDKTGTLTRNQMTVTYIWSGMKMFYAQTGTPDIPGAQPVDMNEQGLNEVLHIASLCCRAKFDRVDVPISERKTVGDATESGLIRCAAARIKDWDSLPSTYPKVFEVPFNSTNKWAMTIHKKPHSNGKFMLYIKGAPERILGLCKTIFDDQDQVVPLNDSHKVSFHETYEMMASKGHRVLAFAALALPDSEYPESFEFSKDPVNYPTKDFTFYGLVSLEDPPKHGVREAIGQLRTAGIKVMMVTGDHPLTAEAVGRKINLMVHDTKSMAAKKRGIPESEVLDSEFNSIVIHGDAIDSLTDEDWDNIFDKDEIIFARTSPKHKLDIVKRAQGYGHVVGVTGDGVNDSPALKKADLGIAMNLSSSDVSKEAAAMILLDDNFASTVAGVTEGRLIFQNLKKSVRYYVTHTIPEVSAFLIPSITKMASPLSALLVLLTDLGFELFVTNSYAWDVSENPDTLMKLPPRKPVNEKSIERRKRKLAADRADFEKLNSGREERGLKDKISVSLWRKIWTRRYWEEKFEESEDDILVDADCLFYAYLEAGSIEAAFCFVAFFYSIWVYSGYQITPYDIMQAGPDFGLNTASPVKGFDSDAQKHMVEVGQSGFYICLLIQQIFNCFICKARFEYPWGGYMIYNPMTFALGSLGAGFGFLMVYAYPFNVIFQTNNRLSPYVWIVGIIGGVVLYIYSILRMAIRKLFIPVKYSEEINGLHMAPTKYSMN